MTWENSRILFVRQSFSVIVCTLFLSCYYFFIIFIKFFIFQIRRISITHPNRITLFAQEQESTSNNPPLVSFVVCILSDAVPNANVLTELGNLSFMFSL